MSEKATIFIAKDQKNYARTTPPAVEKDYGPNNPEPLEFKESAKASLEEDALYEAMCYIHGDQEE